MHQLATENVKQSHISHSVDISNLPTSNDNNLFLSHVSQTITISANKCDPLLERVAKQVNSKVCTAPNYVTASNCQWVSL